MFEFMFLVLWINTLVIIWDGSSNSGDIIDEFVMFQLIFSYFIKLNWNISEKLTFWVTGVQNTLEKYCSVVYPTQENKNNP